MPDLSAMTPVALDALKAIGRAPKTPTERAIYYAGQLLGGMANDGLDGFFGSVTEKEWGLDLFADAFRAIGADGAGDVLADAYSCYIDHAVESDANPGSIGSPERQRITKAYLKRMDDFQYALESPDFDLEDGLDRFILKNFPAGGAR